VKPYIIYNQSCTDMSPVASSSVDIGVASPPFNINSAYSIQPDRLPIQDHQELLQRCATEMYRVLIPGGIFVIEATDIAFSYGQITSLPGYLAKVCLGAGFGLIERHIGLVNYTGGYEKPERRANEDFITQGETGRSNTMHLLVFQKGVAGFDRVAGQILYYDYHPAHGHLCPFPKVLIDFILDRFFKPGQTVLDPFAGVQTLGAAVVRRGGKSIGFEVDPNHCRTAEHLLAEAARG